MASSIAQFGSLSLTSFGAVPDGRILHSLGTSMAAGSDVLNYPGAGFTAADVGKVMRVGGAGAQGDVLRTTIELVQSGDQVTLAAAAATDVADMGITYGTNATPALMAALTTADAQRGGEIVVDGFFMIADPVVLPFFAERTRSRVRFKGLGSFSGFIVGTTKVQDTFTFMRAQLDFDDIAFLGTPNPSGKTGSFDARKVFDFLACEVAFTRCYFGGLFADRAIVWGELCRWRSENCIFGGSFTSGGSNLLRSTIEMHRWHAFEDKKSEFIDYGAFRGLLIGKSGGTGTTAWVRIGNPEPTVDGARSAGIARFVGTIMDEATNFGIHVESTGDRIHAVEIFGTRQNILSLPTAVGLYCKNVEDVRVDRSRYGLSPSSNDFGNFVDCERVLIDGVKLAQTVNGVRATDVRALTIRDTPLQRLKLTNCNYHPQDSRHPAYGIVKASGEISDSDFLAPPAPWTKGLISSTMREYTRSSGGWVYRDFDGGGLAGPNVIPNGDFANGQTEPWVPTNGAELSVVNGNTLRITNTTLYADAKLFNIPVVIGQKYRFTTIFGAASTALAYVYLFDDGTGNLYPPNARGQSTPGVETTYTFDFVARTTGVTAQLRLSEGRSGYFTDVALSIRAV